MIELGKKYKDVISGFVGTATGYVTYISGCNQVLLAPLVDKDGKLLESQWFDEQRCQPLAEPAISLDNSKAKGFDTPAPKR